MWYVIAIIIIAAGVFLGWQFKKAPTYEQQWPDFHPQCSDCNAGGETCGTCPYKDKNYNPLAEVEDEDEPSHLNWMGTDDVPPAPEGMRVYSKGKLSMAYINAKDEDIQAALDVVMRAISANSPEHHLSVLKQVHAHLMRALL